MFFCSLRPVVMIWIKGVFLGQQIDFDLLLSLIDPTRHLKGSVSTRLLTSVHYSILSAVQLFQIPFENRQRLLTLLVPEKKLVKLHRIMQTLWTGGRLKCDSGREWLILAQEVGGSSWLCKGVSHLDSAREWLILAKEVGGSFWLCKGVAHLDSAREWLILTQQGSGSS